LHSAFAILTAIVERRKTGKGRSIDVSISESFASILEESVLEYTVMHEEPHQIGDGYPYYAPYGYYRCKGDYSWIAVSVTSDKEWEALCKIIGNSALASEKYSDSLRRWQNRHELDWLIQAWTSENDAHEVMQLLQEVGVPAGVCNNASDILDEVQLRARNFFWPVTSPDTGTYPLAGPVIKLSETPATLRLSPPALGEHNEYVLSDLLGFSAEEIKALKEERIIGNEPAY
jgi:benzylsuccinate CoA-transferase BbsF subunit